MPARRPRPVVVVADDSLAELTVTRALVDPEGAGGKALLLIEAAILARNMLKFEFAGDTFVFGTLEEPA